MAEEKKAYWRSGECSTDWGCTEMAWGSCWGDCAFARKIKRKQSKDFMAPFAWPLKYEKIPDVPISKDDNNE
jgi:hypothetical protein